ncbi:MAG: AbrB/MazE/SpoVT family DNA-binding domain-containing protein [Acidobacteriaceae bacterium]
MATHCARVSAKGQLVIPADLREELRLSPGTEVSIQRQGNTLVLRPITPQFIQSLAGCTQGAGLEREQRHADDEER